MTIETLPSALDRERIRRQIKEATDHWITVAKVFDGDDADHKIKSMVTGLHWTLIANLRLAKLTREGLPPLEKARQGLDELSFEQGRMLGRDIVRDILGSDAY